jgi:hypothetical protein
MWRIKYMMNWKVLIPLMIIILTIGFFHFYQGSVIYNVEKEIISHLESGFSVEIDYSKIDIWPLNKMVVKDLQIKNRGQMLLSSSKAIIYYDIEQIVRKLQDLGPDKWMQAINHINIEEPVLDLALARDVFPKRENDSVGLPQLRVELSQGKIIYKKGNNNFIIDNNMSTIEVNEAGFKLKSNSNLQISNLTLSNYNFEEYNFQHFSLEDIDLQMTYSSNNWQVNLGTKYFALEEINDLAKFYQDKLLSDQFAFDKLKGKGRLVFEVKGRGREIAQYAGEFFLKKSQALFNYNDYVKRDMLSEVSGSLIFNSEDDRIDFNKFNFKMAGSLFSLNGYLQYGNNRELHLNLNSDKFSLGEMIPAWDRSDKINGLNIVGRGNLGFSIRGSLKDPEVSLDFYLPQGNVGNQLVSHFKTHLRYKDSIVYIDFLNLYLNQDNQLRVKGIFDPKQKEYNFKVMGDNVALKMINKSLNKIGYNLSRLPRAVGYEFEGDLDFDFIVSGDGFKPDDLRI